ncbi:MAG: 50S ribosomal protein L21 [Pirellulaceae bacterium]|nr:MAG: 50S ribosomal protein L21 [Pirellulaceae bacterium]
MYAIIADGGRQYKVEEGQELVVDYREVPQGSQLRFEQVLAVADEQGLHLGRPTLPGAAVVADVLGAHFGEKIYIQKFRRRKNYRRRTGHRQVYTRVRIARIEIAGDTPLPSASEEVASSGAEA